MQHREADHGGAFRWRIAGPTQPGIDIARRELAVARRDRHGPLAGHHVAAGEQAQMAGHHGAVHLHRAVRLGDHAHDVVQECAVGLLAQCQHHAVGLQGIEFPGRAWAAFFVQLHAFHGQGRADNFLDAGQPADFHALFQRFIRLEPVRGHVFAVAAVDDQRFLGAQPPGAARRIHGGVAAAIDHHPPPQHRFAAGADVAQHRHRIQHLRRIPSGDIGVLGDVRADGDEDRVEPARGLFRQHVGHRMLQHDTHPEPLDPGDFGGKGRARQAVGGDAELQHPTGNRTGLVDLHLMAEAGQVVGGGQAGRAGPHHQHTLAGGRGGDGIVPVLRIRFIAQEAFNRVDRHRRIHFAAVAAGLAGVIADPAVRPRQRIVGDQRFPRRAIIARLGQTEPGLDILPRRASVVARRQQVRPHGMAGAERAGAPVPGQIDDRSQIARGSLDHWRFHQTAGGVCKPRASATKQRPCAPMAPIWRTTCGANRTSC